MASIYTHKTGYRAQVAVNGIKKTKTFRTKREASAWASAMETDLRSVANLPASERHTLQDAFAKYAEEEAPKHKGERWEVIRLKLIATQLDATKPIGLVTATDLSVWRDARLKQVSQSSVLRELKLLGSVFEVARLEWKWISVNPVRDVKKPRASEHRERTISWRETKAQLKAMGYSHKQRVTSVRHAAAVLFMLALRTGMRAGELCGLTWDRVYPKYCRLVETKNGKGRSVPLTPKAERLLEKMRGWDEDSVFAIKPESLDAVFRRYREKTGLTGYTFHDARHTAATRMAKKVDILTLCKIFGWSSTKMALVYYNPKAEDIADLL